eukprot:TRINITY_DN5267_c0_g1_i1.p1 TRINITY_DN5267_c0_g1~~TRINITY_DN5267_c0_g1_i1.p1  ORF type:complete len:308 (-),score=58.05 TRINITY_DN5267_c0_g1_i1:655-1578(-)
MSSMTMPAPAAYGHSTSVRAVATVSAVVECQNGCGWTAFPGHATCCKSCSSTSGPHARDCLRKNQRIGVRNRNKHRSKMQMEEMAEAMNRAIEEARAAPSGAHMMDVLSIFVETEWFGGLDALTGNIYRAVGFGTMSWPSTRAGIRSNVKFMGAVLIWLVQLFGPLVMLVTMGFFKMSEWKFLTFAHLGTRLGDKVLGLLLIIAFQLNVIFSLEGEASSWEQVTQVFTYLRCREKKHTSTRVLWIGAATHCYVFVMSCFCVPLLMGQAESTKDVLFDALGILFLYNLDQILIGFLQVEGPAHTLEER